MKSRKIAVIMAAAIAAGAILGACTSTEGNTTNATAGDTKAAQSGQSGEGKAKENASNSADAESVTLTVFDKNSKSYKWDDRIAKEVTKRTGVHIEIQNPTGDPKEKLALLLAGQDYPDIVLMDRGDEIVKKYIDAGALIELDDLIETQGPNIKEMYGDTLNRIKYKDGHNYYLTNWYGPDPDPVAGFIMRYDMMVESVGKERADSDEPFTQQELLDILKEYKEKHPQVDGSEFIGMTMNGNERNYFNTLKGMYGIKTYYEKDGSLYHETRDPNYLKMLKFINQMYLDGTLDKEWVVNNTNLFTQKLAAGNVMGALCAYWDVTDANTSLKSTHGEDSFFAAYKVLGEGVAKDQTTSGGRSSLGWDAIGITNNCKDVDAAMRLINFLASQEGQDLLLWGIEGEDYTVTDGKYTPNQELYDNFKKDYTKTMEKSGICKWTWFVNNKVHDDGTPNRLPSIRTENDKATNIAWQNLTDTYWDTSIYDDLTPAANSPQGLMAQKVKDVYEQSFPKIVNAASSEEAENLYHQMITEMEAAGLKDVEAVITANYEERKELWGID